MIATLRSWIAEIWMSGIRPAFAAIAGHKMPLLAAVITLAAFYALFALFLTPERDADDAFPHQQYAISFMGGCSANSVQCGQYLYSFLGGTVRAREFPGNWAVEYAGGSTYRIIWKDSCEIEVDNCNKVLGWSADSGSKHVALFARGSTQGQGALWQLQSWSDGYRMIPAGSCSQTGVCNHVLGLERSFFERGNPDRENAFNSLRLISFSATEASSSYWALSPTVMEVADQTVATGLLDLTLTAQTLTGPFYDQLYFELHDHVGRGMAYNGPRPRLMPTAYFLSFLEDSERSITIPLDIRNCDVRPVNIQVLRKRNSDAQSPETYAFNTINPHVLREFSITPSDRTETRSFASEFGNYTIRTDYQPPADLPPSRCGATPTVPIEFLFLATVLAAMVPALYWPGATYFRLHSDRRQRLLARTGQAIVGEQGIYSLARRRDLLIFDLFLMLIAAILLLRAADGESVFNYSQAFEFVAAAGYAFFFVLMTSSLILRVFRRRIAPGTALLACIAVSFPVGIIIAIISEMADTTSSRFEVLFLVAGMAAAFLGFIAALFLVFRLWRNHKQTPRTWRLTLMFFAGALLCNMLFILTLGQDASARFALILPLGEVAVLLVIALAAWLQFRHLDTRWSFLIWPVTAIIGGLVLRILVGAASVLSEATDGGVSAGAGDVFVALLIAGLAAEGVLLAKRVWVDRDPQARRQAVVVRGALVILHAITPVLLFVFVALSVLTFTSRVGSELAVAGQEFEILSTSFDRIRNEAVAARGRAEGQIASVEQQIEALRDRLASESQQALEEFDKIYEESVQAALNSGSAVAADVVREGEAIVSEVAAALTPPPLDLGLFEIPNPFGAIGDGLMSALSGLMPDIDFGAILSQLSKRAVDTVTREFAGPMARAQSIITGVETLGNDISVQARAQANELTQTASIALSVLNEELETSYKTAGRLMTVSVKITYQLIILSASVLLALLLFLFWRMVNGFVEMGREVERGLRLMAGKDTDEPAKPKVQDTAV